MSAKVVGRENKGKLMKPYEYEIWANGFRRWHAKINFTPPIGNTGEAEIVANNALRNVKRQLRKTISLHDTIGDDYRFQWQIVDNKELGTGHLASITIAEKEEN